MFVVVVAVTSTFPRIIINKVKEDNLPNPVKVINIVSAGRILLSFRNALV